MTLMANFPIIGFEGWFQFSVGLVGVCKIGVGDEETFLIVVFHNEPVDDVVSGTGAVLADHVFMFTGFLKLLFVKKSAVGQLSLLVLQFGDALYLRFLFIFGHYAMSGGIG